jgi:hypothetical protein
VSEGSAYMSTNCISCDLPLDYEKFVYVRDMSTDNMRSFQITVKPPFDPSPEPAKYGPFCARCQGTKLSELRSQLGKDGEHG